jgi:hypothetical protein
VRLVADHEVVGGGLEIAHVAREPGVGLNRDGIGDGRPVTLGDLGGDPVAVSLDGKLPFELRDEQAAVGEDENADRAGRLDEPGRGDRLAGGRRMPEAVTPDCPGIGGRSRRLEVIVLVVDRLLVFLVFLLVGERLDSAVPILGLSLRCRDQLGEHAGERVDLVAPKLGARGEVGRLFREDAFEPEHEREADLPLGRGRRKACVDLFGRLVERRATGGSGRQRFGGVLAFPQEGLARPGFCSEGGGRQAICCLRVSRRLVDRFLHGRSTRCAAAIQKMRPRPAGVARKSIADAGVIRLARRAGRTGSAA